MYTVNLMNVHKEQVELVGGKGANLGEMIGAGFPVPNGFCVTSKAYKAFVKENELEKVIDTSIEQFKVKVSEREKIAKELRTKFEKANIPSQIEAEVRAFYNQMGDKVRVAVRSSATAEDLPEASFAGQQETYLNIKGIDEVLETVKKCFASLWTQRAMNYRMETGFDQIEVLLSVVIQEMVEGDKAGVLFTVNPINYHIDEVMINAAYGLGESVVSGLVTPDTLVCDKAEGKIKDKQLGSKEISIIYDKDKGTKTVQNSKDKREAYVLSNREVKQLVEIAKKIETHYGLPQDIEWAIKDEKIYILQTRAITTLNHSKVVSNYNKEQKMEQHVQDCCKGLEEQDSSKRDILNNLIEHCPTPLYPIDFLPFQIVSDEKSRVFASIGIKAESDISLDKEGVIHLQSNKVKISPKILKVPFIIRHFTNFKRNQAETKACFSKVKQQLKNLEKIDSNQLDVRALIKQIQLIMELTSQISYVRFRYNIFPSVVISKRNNGRFQKIQKGLTEYDLLSDLPYKTWQLNKAIKELVKKINDEPSLKEMILALPIHTKEQIDEGLKEIETQYPSFYRAYNELLKEFGWKSTCSYKAFSETSYNEDPTSLIRLLKVLINSTDVNREQKEKYQAILQKVKDRFSSKVAQKVYETIEEIRAYHMAREESLYLLEHCYAIARIRMQAVALHYPKLFYVPKDIWYLTIEEIYNLVEEKDMEHYKKLIQIRKKSRGINEALWASCNLQGEMENGKIKGIAGSDGIVKGRVCVIQEMSEFHKLQAGDILVCKYTDPAWTPLFALASAVVSDTGGPLSHSAIVAREYRIPAVLGVGNATTLLKDGDYIKVDGNEGYIFL